MQSLSFLFVMRLTKYLNADVIFSLLSEIISIHDTLENAVRDILLKVEVVSSRNSGNIKGVCFPI